MTPSLRRLEIVVTISLSLLGAFATWEATRMPFGTAAMPGPAMMPMALGVLLMLSAACLLVSEWKARPPATAGPVTLGNRHVALAIASIVVAGLLFERAGFLITSVLFLFAMLFSLSGLGWWRSLLAAVAASIAAQYLFQNLLNVRLPPLPFVT